MRALSLGGRPGVERRRFCRRRVDTERVEGDARHVRGGAAGRVRWLFGEKKRRGVMTPRRTGCGSDDQADVVAERRAGRRRRAATPSINTPAKEA